MLGTVAGMTNKLLVGTAAGVALTALTVLGCSAASATASPTSSAKPGAGNVHMTAYTDNDGPTDTVVVSGAVGDYGKAVNVFPNGTVDPDHTSLLELQMQHGTFRLDVASIDKAFVAAMVNRFPTNTKTCSGTVAVSQKVPIVAGSGTGAYQGAAGSFTLTITLDEVDKLVAGQPCTASNAFLDQVIVITGAGNVTFQAG